MRSCIFVFYLAASAVALHPAVLRGESEDPERLYENRADLPSARRCADLLREQLAQNPTFETAWKLSRVDYWLGGHAPEAERRKFFEEGVEAARKATSIAPARPDGYFWLAANMGTMAESFGLRAGLKYRKPVKEALETVVRIDPGFGEGSAQGALGRWYDKVPGLLGGSSKLAEEHLKTALKYSPNRTVTHYFLADLYADSHRTAEARVEAQKALDAPLDPRFVPEDRDWKAKAERLLGTLR